MAAVEPVADGDGEGLLIFPRGGEDIVADVADLARAHRWQVSLLRVEHGRLDDVFRDITTAPSEAGASRRRGLRSAMRNVLTIFRREFVSYFTTPLAYVFIVIFLVMAGMLTFFVGNFFDRGQADLQPFFAFHPWLYLVLIPALSMRLWAEERRSGTIELFLTLPIRMTEAVVGKFLAAWCFAGIALALTFPFWLTVNFLGHPDNGVILASYIGSWLMAGALLAVGAFVSAATKNQVIAFVVTAALAFVFTAAGSPAVIGVLQGWAPQWLIDAFAQIELSQPFQRHHPRRHRSARRRLFRVDHDRVPVRQRDPRRPRKSRVR